MSIKNLIVLSSKTIRYKKLNLLVCCMFLLSFQHHVKSAEPQIVIPSNAPLLRADEKEQYTKKTKVKKKSDNERRLQNIKGEENTAIGQKRKETDLKTTSVKDTKTGRPIKIKQAELLVKFRKATSDIKKQSTMFKYHILLDSPHKTSRIGKIGYHRVRIPFGVNLENTMRDLKHEAMVDNVEYNAIVHSLSTSDYSDSEYLWPIDIIDAPKAWFVTQGDSTIQIAVIDSGIDATHPAFSNNLVSGYNFLDGNENTEDLFGHGTQVSGIIAAQGTSNVAGIAPNCSIVPLKVLDGNGYGTVAAVAGAIIYAADQGYKVINLSLGTYYESDVLREAVEYAWDKGCVMVVAGGNEGTDEACYPAAYYETIGVGAIDRFLSVCSFSNQANYIDVAAPGKDILTTGLNGGYTFITGTSSAAAHVSGVVALLFSHRTDLSNENVQSIIRASSEDIADKGWDRATGMGLINCNSSLSCSQINGPDIGIIDMYTLPANPMPGQQVKIFALIRNHGTSIAKKVNISVENNNSIISKTDIAVLDPKEIKEVQLIWETTELASAEVEGLTATATHLTNESNITDNARTVNVSLSLVPIHDVSIFECKVKGTHNNPGEIVTIQLEIANLGNSDANNIQIHSLFKKDHLAEIRNIDLSISERKILTYEWVIPNEIPGPNQLAPVYPLIFEIIPILNEKNISNNIQALKFGFRKNDSTVIPFHKVESGKEIHQWIAKEAYNYFLSQIEGADISSYIGTINGSFTENNNDILEGTYAEDKNNRDPLSQFMPYMRHFCAGADGQEIYDGLVAYDSNYEQALNIWNNYTINTYDSNKSLSFYRLGHVAHLLTDMTVPAHTHNDEHPISESYEDAMAYSGQFKWWYYGCSRSGDWDYPLSHYSNLYSIFYRTINYTEDYDSDDEDGDNSPYYNPPDYPNTKHRPSEVSRSSGINSTELTIIADDLMPSAIRRVADLYRLFYSKVDTSKPNADMTYPDSEDLNNKTLRDNMNAFNLTAIANDSQSGTLKKGYQFLWSYWKGSEWSDWADVSPSPTYSSASFTPPYDNTTYAFHVIAENGGGLLDSSPVKYLRIDTPLLDDNYEVNNSTSTSYDLSDKEQTWLSNINGLGIQSDDDYYKINVSGGYERLLIDCQFTHVDGDIDIELLDSSGNTLDYSQSSNDDEYIDYVVPSSGTYYIRVYLDNAGNTYNLWWDDIEPPKPALSYSSIQIDDDAIGGSYGNDNGQINAGETIELIITLQNTGLADAHTVTAHLETSDPYVTSISDADESYGDIPLGSTSPCNADYDFTISPSCPDGHVITFNLNLIKADEGTWSDSFQVTVHTPPIGSLTVNLTPPEAITRGGQWRLTSGPDTNWKNSGEQINYLPIGDYTIECKDVYGWDTPESQIKTITESSFTIPTVYLRSSPAPDINSDGHVNLADFSLLSKQWLLSPCNEVNGGCSGSDIDYTGAVDIEDILIMGEHWLEIESSVLWDFESDDLSAWNFGGDTPEWSIASQEKASGSFSVKSGSIADGQMTYIYRSQVVPRGHISFYRKVSSEYGDDWFRFYVDGNLVDVAGGESDWKNRKYFVDAGLHTFYWAYQKGDTNTIGSDCVWIDNIMFYAQNPDADVCAWLEMTAYKVLGENITIQPIQNCNYIPFYETWAIKPYGKLTGTFVCPQAGQYALRVKHLSSYSSDCPGEGYSPVTISVNGSEVISNYDPAENHGSTHGLVTDTWIINANEGTNTFQWEAGEAMCTYYWIQKIEVICLD
ncbi:MAG: S8 family serine peptidase [Phycisphaerae bacterium]|nr:S8 family serine peptidase [Phycisphaerae bacterium]